MSEKEFIERFDSKERFTEKELRNIVFEDTDIQVYKETEEDHGRWTFFMTTIIKVGDRYFSIDWQKGLTENQDNYFGNHPEEIFRQEREETIKIEEFFTLEELQKKGIILND